MAPKDERIALILSGSATPACDLLVMVDDGEITSWEATQALRSSSPRCADVHSVAAEEIECMRHYNA